MIDEIKAYRLKCDGCGIFYEEEEGYYSIFANDEQIQEVLDWVWIEKDNKHYCPNCIPNEEAEK
jgi:NAD-dependent dihydropyrimidine dehydrogenase PreA subunit